MTRALVVAKAPVVGRVKTRLGEKVGMGVAAELAAAALLDTIDACREAFGADRCILSLTGDLLDATRGAEIADALDGWWVSVQRGAHFAERLANAHTDVPRDGPVVQVGMDTPQLRADHLHAAAAELEEADAVLGPAVDGGWWILGLNSPTAAHALRDVPMSTPTTCADTREALEVRGLTVAGTRVLRDVDTTEDADAVAREGRGTRFAGAWARVGR